MRDFMKILQQAQEMQGKFQKIQEDLQQLTITGTAGGGLVTVEVSGTGQIRRMKLDPSVKDKTPAEALNALRLEIDGMRRDLEAELEEWMRR